MLAGVVNLDPSGTVLPDVERHLRRVLSRNGHEEIREARLPGAYLIRADVGSLPGCDGVWQRGNAASIMAGDPLLPDNRLILDSEVLLPGLSAPERNHRTIALDLLEGGFASLRTGRGVFCGCVYCADGPRTLHLFTDKLGVRPLYFFRHGNTVTVSSALRILEGLPWIPLQRDDLGVAETIAFGYPLAGRTRYQGIQVLREAEILRFSAVGSDERSYWRWDQVRQTELTDQESVSEAGRLFREAVRIRQGDQEEAVAYLSGGMDSRAIVAVLAELGVRVTAVNFSHAGVLDHILARLFADRIGCDFLQTSWESGPPGFDLTINLWMRRAVDRGLLPPMEPRAVWSGDGGSVGLGTVYMDETMVSLMREGRSESALDRLRAKNHFVFPYPLVRRERRGEIRGQLHRTLSEEVCQHHAPDPGQNLFLFLMANDQRRHLHGSYEDLDLHRLEIQLPFFDSSFLEFVLGLPLDQRLYHRFYTRWYGALPSAVREVPYQTYPGHVPCPIPAPRGWDHQWKRRQRGFFAEWFRRASYGRLGLRLLGSGQELGPVSRSRLLAVSLLQILGLRNYDYLAEAARKYALKPLPS
jgi:hypothetical protein